MRTALISQGIAVCCAITGLAHAQTTYVSTTDPGTNRPPDAPWMEASEMRDPPNEVGDCLWLGKDNFLIEVYEKTVSFSISGANANNWGAADTHGYRDDDPATEVISGLTGIHEQGKGDQKRRTFTVRLIPQPDWEVIKFVLLDAAEQGDSALAIESHSHCSDISIRDTLDINDAFFGVETEDSIRITEVVIFPEFRCVDPKAKQSFSAPPKTGNWTHEIVFVDPEGTPRPLGGVSWTTDGDGLVAEAVYGLVLSMVGEPDVRYSYFAFDEESGEHKFFQLDLQATCPWDLDDDDNVGTGDLILLLGSWGNPYGTVDLIELLGAWGPCP